MAEKTKLEKFTELLTEYGDVCEEIGTNVQRGDGVRQLHAEQTVLFSKIINAYLTDPE